MDHNTIAVARSIVVPLHRSEQSVDVTIAKLSQLLAALPVARSEVALPYDTASEAFDCVAKAIDGAVAARHWLIAAHRRLKTAQSSAGIIQNFGPTVDEPRLGYAATGT